MNYSSYLPSKTTSVYCLSLIVLNAYIYAEALTYVFPSSDTLSLIYSSRIQSFRDFIDILSTRLIDLPSFSPIYYRPVTSLSFSIDSAIWGTNPLGFQLTNLIIQILIATSLYFFLDLVWNIPKVLSFLTSGVFSIHPILTSNVPAPARRQDMLVVFFILSTFIIYTLYRKSKTKPLLYCSVFVFLLALGSKESGVILLFILIPLMHFYNQSWRTTFRNLVPFIVVTMVYLTVRRLVLNSWMGGREIGFRKQIFENLKILDKTTLDLIYPLREISTHFHALENFAFVYVFLIINLLLLTYLTLRSSENLLTKKNPKIISSFVGSISLTLLVFVFLAFPKQFLSFFKTLPLNGTVLLDGTVLALTKHVLLLVTGLSYLISYYLTSIRSRSTPERKGENNFRLLYTCCFIWLLSMLSLLILSGSHTSRNSYLLAVPFSILITVFPVKLIRDTTDRRILVHSIKYLLAGLLVLISLGNVYASPLLHSFNGWSCVSKIHQGYFRFLSSELSSSEIKNSTISFDRPRVELNQQFPDVSNPTVFRSHSLNAWISLKKNTEPVKVRQRETLYFKECPAKLNLTVEKSRGGIKIRLHK